MFSMRSFQRHLSTNSRILIITIFDQLSNNLRSSILQINTGKTYMLHTEAAYQFADIVLCVFSFFWPSIITEACNNM